jgi:hypothetical protein
MVASIYEACKTLYHRHSCLCSVIPFPAIPRVYKWESTTMTKRLGYYLAGFAIGILISLVVSYAIGKHSLAWSSTCGNLGGVLAVAWAQHRGIVPTPEDLYRPLSLFPPEERNGQEPKR